MSTEPIDWKGKNAIRCHVCTELLERPTGHWTYGKSHGNHYEVPVNICSKHDHVHVYKQDLLDSEKKLVAENIIEGWKQCGNKSSIHQEDLVIEKIWQRSS